jgi:hypothetical protein
VTLASNALLQKPCLAAAGYKSRLQNSDLQLTSEPAGFQPIGVSVVEQHLPHFPRPQTFIRRASLHLAECVAVAGLTDLADGFEQWALAARA